MKKIYILICALFFVVIVYFTINGNDVYQKITPKVSVVGAHYRTDAGSGRYFRIPKDALTLDHTVWGLTSTQGYSMTIYRIVEIKIDGIAFRDEDYVYFSESINGATSILRNAADVNRMGLTAGDKVIPFTRD